MAFIPMEESYKSPDPPSRRGVFSRLRRAYLRHAAPSKPDIFESGRDATAHLEIPSIDTQLHPLPSNKNFECGDCEYTTPHKATFKRHVETVHSTANRYFCPIQSCSRSTKSFSRWDNLMRHVRDLHPPCVDTQPDAARDQDQYLSNESDSGTQATTESTVQHGPTDTSFIEAGDDWCSISDRTWKANGLIEEVTTEGEDEWEDLGPKEYVVKRPLSRLSVSELQYILKLAGKDTLIRFPGESSSEKGENVRGTIESMLKAKEAARTMAKLATQLPINSPADRWELPSNSPREAFELLDKKIRETMQPSKGKKISQHEVLHLYERFWEKSDLAYQKLVGATEDPANMRSPHLKNFVSSLVSLENIIGVGCTTLSDFLEQKFPTDLKSIYCMLHVSYAMSQSTTMPEHSHITDTQFSQSAATWKELLPVVSDSGVREQDVFDELLEIMWSEIKEGFEIITEWLDNLTREQAISEVSIINEVDPEPPTAGVFDADDPAWAGMFDPLFPILAEDNQENPDTTYSPNASGIVRSEDSQPDYNIQPQFTSIETLSQSPASLPWISLSQSLVITAAVSFLRELKAAGIVFFHLVGSLGPLLARFYLKTQDVPLESSPIRLLNIQERQSIVGSIRQSLNSSTYPDAAIIIHKASELFLEGFLAGLDDLEECMVAFLRILCQSPHSFLVFFSAIVINFNDYYNTELPAETKCCHDRYSHPRYVCIRIKEETAVLDSADRRDQNSTLTGSPSSDATSRSKPNAPVPQNSRKRDNRDAGFDQQVMGVGKRSKVNGTIAKPQESQREYTFKNETGIPTARKRCRVLRAKA